MNGERRLPVGAEVVSGGVDFRVWTPRCRQVEVEIETGDAAGRHALVAEENGYFSCKIARAVTGDLYRFRLDGRNSFPDPASRFQPDGPHGPSQIVDPAAFAWSDHEWEGRSLSGQVLYEMHVGTFTREGTWEAAARELPELSALGITVIEVMPVADFPGRFGWGYDGVNLFAPTRLYGQPDDFRRFVDRAHASGLAVILDVVYNHLGPDGNYLPEFADAYFTDRYECEWGKALNFDGPDSDPVREFFIANAGYWIDEFHLDGFRLDATQAIHDASDRHVLLEISRRVRAAARGRSTIIVTENEPQNSDLVRPAEKGGCELDGLWNDDFHHSAGVAVTGHSEAYYSDHLGTPQEFISAAKYGYLFQGQRYSWQDQRRGRPAFDLAPWRFVNYTENHDQVANSGRGLRLHRLTAPGRYRAMTACLLLFPGTPMIFMGQEFAASSPFFYFADHNPELAALVRKGRAEFLSQFRSLDRPGLADGLADPSDPATFDRCKLDFVERTGHAEWYRLHKDLLRLRRDDPAFRPRDQRHVDGAVLGPNAFLLRYFVDGLNDRLLLVNFGRDLHLNAAPEPLLAPPPGTGWNVRWSSDDPAYGGDGTPPAEVLDGWRILGEAAVVLAPEPLPPREKISDRLLEEKMRERKQRERTRLLE
jgi:maltooligosyltrehalose trehalohydrolase